MKKTILFAAMICIPGVAHAADPEAFTVVVEGSSTTMIGVENGPWGVHVTNTGRTTWADGTVTTDTGECVGMGQPPNDSLFQAHQICNVEGKEGSFTVLMGCNPDPTNEGAMGCVGQMWGKTGIYKGRGGGITMYAKDGKGHGAGQWGAASE